MRPTGSGSTPISRTSTASASASLARPSTPPLDGCWPILPRLGAQLGGLERRTARGGRDSIDHAPGAHDDMVNAAAGALVSAIGIGSGVDLNVYIRAYGG